MSFIRHVQGTIRKVFRGTQLCPFCSLEIPLGVKRCPRCGHEFNPKEETRQ